MTAPQKRPARPREARPELVAAVARRNALRNIDRELERLAREPRTPAQAARVDALLEQRHTLTRKAQR